ncbi:Hypothetical predicted protein [Lecanosticta acicola]|uniref:DUF1750-domain-containing protein n=1 Tax=Lecanosticta acicola TaxID=111012 RepID=A0AAI8YZN3_9PEZI|nr:Hypothetical predicted protein [Lecanosticta acicola]
MQNPSQGVAPQLLPHVHLTSLHRFPQNASLGIEQVYRYLCDAPTIVKQVAPMTWQYVQAPQDGTIWLEWIAQERNDQMYPSDGYIWGDPEQSFQQNFNGYTIEIRVHRIGYRPGHDQMASHARTRYHFLHKSPNVNAPPPDTSLWLVHYHQADQVVPAQTLPVAREMQQIIAQRRWLESQGRLDRRDFMLHDREHWPTLNIPGHPQQQSQYGAVAMQNRYPQQAYPQQAGQPPSKKARTSGPGIPPSSSDGQPETTIEMEEDTALGDFFDHLTPRDISLARYTQHHRWMEEVFSSPYATSQIVPPDLGLGLMGELKGLTDGILEPPSLDFRDQSQDLAKPQKAKEAEPFTNLKKEQVEEFGKRVQKHLEEGQAEIERMKAEHAAKMQDWKKVKTLMQAEKRLRYATWEAAEGDATVFRLEEPVTNGTDEGANKENMDDVVKDVEGLLKVKIDSHSDATRIARGGLRDRKAAALDYDQQANQEDVTMANGQQHSTSTSTPNGATEPTTYHEDPTAVSQTVGESSKLSQPPATLDHNTPGINEQDRTQGRDNSAGEALEDMPGIEMMDMDMDMGNADINFGETNTPDLGDGAAAPPPAESQPQAPGATGSSVPLSAPPESTDPPAPPTQPAQEATAAAESGLGDGTGDNMFNDDPFDGLTNIDNGDTLIDFDGGGMGMDDSAFGDALHGMDDGQEGEGAGGS